jgi:hypothetical protein
MIGRTNLGIACGVVMVVGTCATAAFGQGGFGWAPGGYGLGYFNYGDCGINQRQIPYYALFPPVYYSYPVPRTYGYSPFAYPPGTMTPEIVSPSLGAVEYINPYVPRSKGAKLSEDKTAGKTYYNPFVQQARNASNASVVEQAGR